MRMQMFCNSRSHGRLWSWSIEDSSFLRSIRIFLPWRFRRNKVESQRNICSVFEYYAVLTGNLLPTFRKSLLPPSSGSPRRLLWLPWRWKRYSPEHCDLHLQGCGNHKSHTDMFVWTVFSLKCSVCNTCTCFDRSTLAILLLHNFVPVWCFVVFFKYFTWNCCVSEKWKQWFWFNM
jgi:hypothetical protein